MENEPEWLNTSNTESGVFDHTGNFSDRKNSDIDSNQPVNEVEPVETSPPNHQSAPEETTGESDTRPPLSIRRHRKVPITHTWPKCIFNETQVLLTLFTWGLSDKRHFQIAMKYQSQSARFWGSNKAKVFEFSCREKGEFSARKLF